MSDLFFPSFAAAFCLLLLEVKAEPSGGKGDKSSRQDSLGENRLKNFNALDKNNDEALSFDEFSQMRRLVKMNGEKKRKLFDFLDQNKDGELRLKELHTREPFWVKELRRTFTQLDADQSGGLDVKELATLTPLSGKRKRSLSRIISKMDLNQSKTIEFSEIRWSRRPDIRLGVDFEKYDVNKSKGLDFDEYSKLPLMKKFPEVRRKGFFKRIDTNESGEISPAEIKAAHKRCKHSFTRTSQE